MNKFYGILVVAAMCASLPAPIIERGGPPPEIRNFSDEQLNQQMGEAKPLTEVGEVDINSSSDDYPSGPLESGSKNISAASSKLTTRTGDPETLLTAERDLLNAAKQRWWSVPLYAGMISVLAFAIVMGLRTWADKKIGALGRTPNHRRPR